jgi:hypothetical protein
MARSQVQIQKTFKNIPNAPAHFRLANPGSPACASVASCRLAPTPLPEKFMILVTIFSVIVLLMCWLCYSGDCRH